MYTPSTDSGVTCIRTSGGGADKGSIMDNRVREDILKELHQIMSHRTQAHSKLDGILLEFSKRLFAAMESVFALMDEHGIPGFGKPRRLKHPGAPSFEAFQCYIEDWSIIFVPLPGIARPNVADEALIAPYLFKQPSARIGVFLTDEPHGEAFYDFLIFEDHSWFAWGYGWPRQQSDIQSTDFEALALELVHSFAKDIFTTWHIREKTVLSAALDAKKRCYEFGLPGEEQHGN